MSRLGDQQIRLLIVLATPDRGLLTPDKVSASLVRRGLLAEDKPGGCSVITPAGLRALADAMEAGRVKHCLDRMREDHEKRRRKPPEPSP